MTEEKLCDMCEENPVCDEWHGLCLKCAIVAEEHAYASEMDRLHEPPEDWEEE